MTYPTAKTSDSYTPAVLLQPNQPPRRCSVLAVRLDSAEGALEKLRRGKAAWAAPGDAETVMAKFAGMV